MSSSTAAAVPLLLSPAEVTRLRESDPKKVTFLDATWFMPNSPRNAKNEFLSARLPGSQFLSLDEVASPHELGLNHMMPDNVTFANACEDLGISSSTHVVIYDSHGVFSAPRALFMFRTFGHDQSSIIDGGLPRWIEEGLPTESGDFVLPPKGSYTAPNLDHTNICSYDQVVASSSHNPAKDSNTELVLDARSAGRFSGVDPEPRPGLSSGHMPNSFSLPFNVFLDKKKTKSGQEYTIFRPVEEIRGELEKAVGPVEADKILQGKRSVITSCGSGMTAGVLWLGLRLLGVNNVALYDESWTGYAMRPTSHIEKA